MRVTFWGTRGSIPTPGPDTVVYGGNTSCVELILPGGEALILDSGSGIRPLGLARANGAAAYRASLLLTHVHWDHIQGFPFFAPAYLPSTTLEIYGLAVRGRSIERLLSHQMEAVHFPVELSRLKAAIHYADLEPGEAALCRGGAEVAAIEVNHTTETLAYRVRAGGRALVFMPDNELRLCGEPGRTSYEALVRFCDGVDLLIHDAQYTAETYRRGWGHSTVAEAVRLACDAGARRLALFHHDPLTTDREIEQRVAEARRDLEAAGAPLLCEAAREGATLDLAAERPAAP